MTLLYNNIVSDGFSDICLCGTLLAQMCYVYEHNSKNEYDSNPAICFTAPSLSTLNQSYYQSEHNATF